MIVIRDLSLAWGAQTVFDDVNVTFGDDQKIGVVGRNGAGKSTLLKVIAGLIQPDDGKILINGAKKIAYMPQEMVLLSEKNIFDEVFSIFDHYIKLEKRQTEIEQLLKEPHEQTEQLLAEYSTNTDELSYFNKFEATKRAETILKGLGFSDYSQPVSTLSVGWKMRIVLAQLLLQKADFYLFDEPTNHLDLSTKEWFFEFLNHGSFGFLLVSHDRHYLEKGCDRIFELESGAGTLYVGNFTDYVKQKEQQRAIKQVSFERQQREIARKQATIDRFRASASKAKMAQSMIKQLEKIERIEVEPVLPTVTFSFPPVTRSGNIVLEVKNLTYRLPDRVLFNSISCEITRGQKVALLAPNGTGKTTFFNLITGKYPLQQGTVTFGHNVTTAFFEQDQTRALNKNNTILEEVSQACQNVSEGAMRGLLGSFLFPGDDVYKKISVLSGGEKNRVAMVKVLLQKANFLLLDEPTNHLDIYAQEVLLQALKQYEGTILLVSHDHDFIQKLANHILELTPTNMYSYSGTYEEYRMQKQQSSVTKKSEAQPEKITSNDTPKTSSKESFALRKKANMLEAKIDKLEQERITLMTTIGELTYGTQEYNAIENRFKELERLINQTTREWESVQRML